MAQDPAAPPPEEAPPAAVTEEVPAAAVTKEAPAAAATEEVSAAVVAEEAPPAAAEEKSATTNVLMVVTNVNKFTDKQGKDMGKQTGWYIPEVAHPYAIFSAAGFGMTFASIKGGECECDFGSYKEWCLKENPDKECVEFLDLIRASDKNEACTDDERKKAVDFIKGSIGRDESGDAKDRKINKIVLNTISFTGLQGKAGNFDIMLSDK